ncbi:G-protein coupled receptor Mth2-like [Nylanderia fulva]|uniref:G-protein coupled receptor Mth2-like n=1 Tax=Nylanderia fulva TaxID=613905 RepID=UPI0010FB8CA2|nr:G-protein coupled receptor Mth2-like [Nylanderia fulva]
MVNKYIIYYYSFYSFFSAFFMYFFSLSANIWLITISFDMWRTFREFSSLQRSIRQRENRKLIYYSFYAWGCLFILATFCVIMESVSSRLPEIWRPEFQLGDCWFSKKETLMIYFYNWRSICIISSVCFSISASMNVTKRKRELVCQIQTASNTMTIKNGYSCI